MNPDEYIVLAGRLAASSDGQSSYRSATSRAYYGAFHIARDFLYTLGITIPCTANVHVFVQRCLNCSANRSAELAASLLGDLHAARNRADYQFEDGRAGTQPVAMLSVETAREVETLIAECVENNEQIKQGIAEYQRRLSNQ
ncbi:MAG: hypothetical protein CMJ78_03690 [Planctomycetaceae bacterium]|nr:hypothetical protein [Planctomycetaceae bacterium]